MRKTRKICVVTGLRFGIWIVILKQKLIFIKSNADTNGRIINHMLDEAISAFS